MTANNNIHTRTGTYLVWQKGHNPESGRRVEAMSGYDARRKVAEEATPPLHILSLMARLVPRRSPTMPNDTIPAWARAEAAALRSAVVWQSNASNKVIARALVAAERRGLERAAQVAETRGPDDDYMDYQVRKHVAALIRKLMESSDEA